MRGPILIDQVHMGHAQQELSVLLRVGDGRRSDDEDWVGPVIGAQAPEGGGGGDGIGCSAGPRDT